MTMVTSMIGVLISVLIFNGNIFADGDPHIEFGCKFDDSQYNLNTPWTGPWPNDPVYGEERTTMQFSSVEEFQKFYDFVEQSRKQMLSNYTFNNVDSFLKFYHQQLYHHGPFNQFYKKYTPTLPLSSFPNFSNAELGTIHLYKILEAKFPSVKDSFVLATVDQDVQYDTVNDLVTNHPLEPPPTFQHEHIAGVIKFSINGSVGYLVIDMKLVLSPSVVLMEDRKHPVHHSNSLCQGDNCSYSLFGDSKDQSYIMIELTEPGNPTSNPNKKSKKGSNSTAVWRSVMYIRKPLCSFVQSVYKAELLLPRRKIVRYNSDGDVMCFCRYLMTAESGTLLIVIKNRTDPLNKALDTRYLIKFDQALTTEDSIGFQDIARCLLQNFSNFRTKYFDLSFVWKTEKPMLKMMAYWKDKLYNPPKPKVVKSKWSCLGF